MQKKVLVTGGAGFIGSHVVDRLVDAGHRVSILDNLSTGNLGNVNAGAEFYNGDIRKLAKYVFKIEKPDYVIHHAAQINVRSSITNPVNDAEQNIVNTLILLELCRQYKVKKVVFASSGGTVYGNPEQLPIKEDAPLRPLSPYGIAKATIERYLDFYQREHGLEHIALRYGNVYGPRQNPKGEAGVISVFISQMLKGETPCIWGDGEQTRDFVYVGDVADANLAALSYNGQEHVFNIGSGAEVSVRYIFEMLSAFSNRRECTHNPDYKEAIPRLCLDASLAERELGWRVKTSLAKGLQETFDYFVRGIEKTVD